MQNSSLSGNTAAVNGGGLFNAGTATIDSGTLAGNSGATGGIYNGSSLSLTNTLVAVHAGTDPDLHGAVSGSYNLIGDGTGMSGISDGSNGNQVGTAGSAINPLRSALGNYGGPTETLAPLPGSPAIDAGGSTVFSFDQRGFPRVVGAGLDIGAVETGAYSITLVSGDNQATAIATPFTQTHGIVSLFFLAEVQFVFSVDSVISRVSNDPYWTQAADWLMHPQ